MSRVDRIEWVDILKGISILWLMVYHFHSVEWLRSPVPVFFFLSGLFFSDKQPFCTFVKKKTHALLIPMLFFFLLWYIYAYVGGHLMGQVFYHPKLWELGTLIKVDAEVANPLGAGAIWFLVSLFEVSIIFYLIRCFSRNKWWVLIFSIT